MLEWQNKAEKQGLVGAASGLTRYHCYNYSKNSLVELKVELKTGTKAKVSVQEVRANFLLVGAL